MPVIPVNRVVDKKRIIGKMGAEEEERTITSYIGWNYDCAVAN
jgi:hypothetical protein